MLISVPFFVSTCTTNAMPVDNHAANHVLVKNLDNVQTRHGDLCLICSATDYFFTECLL